MVLNLVVSKPEEQKGFFFENPLKIELTQRHQSKVVIGCWSILIFSTEAPSVILLVSTSSFLLSAYLVAFSKILLLWIVLYSKLS